MSNRPLLSKSHWKARVQVSCFKRHINLVLLTEHSLCSRYWYVTLILYLLLDFHGNKYILCCWLIFAVLSEPIICKDYKVWSRERLKIAKESCSSYTKKWKTLFTIGFNNPKRMSPYLYYVLILYLMFTSCPKIYLLFAENKFYGKAVLWIAAYVLL